MPVGKFYLFTLLTLTLTLGRRETEFAGDDTDWLISNVKGKATDIGLISKTHTHTNTNTHPPVYKRTEREVNSVSPDRPLALRVRLMIYCWISQVRSHSSVSCVTSGPETTRLWSSTCAHTTVRPRTSAPSARTSARAWPPCRSTWRATSPRTCRQTGG